MTMTDTDDDAVSSGAPTTPPGSPVTGASVSLPPDGLGGMPSALPGSLAPAGGLFGGSLSLQGLAAGLLGTSKSEGFAKALSNGLIGAQLGQQEANRQAMSNLQLAYAPATARFAYDQGLSNDAFTKLYMAARGFDPTTGLPRTTASVPGQMAPAQPVQQQPPQAQLQSAPQGMPPQGGIIPAVSQQQLAAPAGRMAPQPGPMLPGQIQQMLQQQGSPVGASAMPATQQMPAAPQQMPQQPQQLSPTGGIMTNSLPASMSLADQYSTLAKNAMVDFNNPASVQAYEGFVGMDPKNAGSVARMRQADVDQAKAGYTVLPDGSYGVAPGAANVAQTMAGATEAGKYPYTIGAQNNENANKMSQIQAEAQQARATLGYKYNLDYGDTAKPGVPNPSNPAAMDAQGNIKTNAGTIIPTASAAPPIPTAGKQLDQAIPAAQKLSDSWADSIPQAQVALQRMNVIKNAFQQIQTGAYQTHKADFLAGLKSAGIPIDDKTSQNIAAVQLALHSTAVSTLNNLSTINKRFANNEFMTMQKNSTSPNLQPQANAEMLANDMGVLQRNVQQARDWQVAQSQGGWKPVQAPQFEVAWDQANPTSGFVSDAAKQIGPLKGQYTSPDQIKQAVKAGNLDRNTAINLLQQNHGMQ